MHSNPRPQNRRGFSLIEVIFALGVMTFALMGILGLVPVGLSNFQKSMDLTVQAQITQELTFMLQRTSFTDLVGLDGNNRATFNYAYDSEGSMLTSDKNAQAAYTAKVTVVDKTATASLVSPSWTQANPPSQFVAVNITITKVASPARPYEFTTYVANTGF